MRNKLSLGAALLVLVAVPAAGARDFTEDDFLAVGKELLRAMKDLDYEGFHSVFPPPDDGEQMSEEMWRDQTRSIMTRLGELGDVTVDELDPPDGAYLTFGGDQGALDVFLILDRDRKIDQIRISQKGQDHAGCSTLPP